MRALCCALLAVGSAAACVKDTLSPVPELTENRGTQLATGEGVSLLLEFAWSADGAAIFYQPDVANPQLKRVPLAGGSPPAVDGPRDEYLDLRAARDGALYFLADVGSDGRRTAYRLRTSGPAQPLGRTRAGVGGRPADGVLVLPSPVAGTAAVLIAPDSVFLDGPTQRRFLTTGCERLIVFSPDGGSLLCRRGSGASVLFGIIDVAAGSLRNAAILGPADGTPQMIRWEETGIQVVFFDFGGYFLRDVTALTTTQLWSVPGTGAVLDFDNTAWSDDGRYIAFWVHNCIDRDGLACRRGQSVLHVVNRNTREDRVAAVAKGAVGGQFMAFSPDNRRIAYTFEKAIFHAPIQ